jgi:diphthine-ammonia ligase
MKAICSWSGGKDSCLACYKAIQAGHEITHLVNFISQEYQRVRFHGTEARLLRLQAEAIGIPLLQRDTTDDGYEEEFKEAVRSILPTGVEGMVFGDIYLQENRKWTHKVSAELGIEPIEPLWGQDPEALLAEFIALGFQATVVSANAEFFGEEWVGRPVDTDLAAYLRANHIDACGENGEFHTFVTDGPLFHRPVKITKARPVLRNGYWLLDTVEYSL